jgi:LPS-assembly lipoprotein
LKTRCLFAFLLLISTLLTACGFHLNGEVQLAKPLHRMYVQSPDQYGYLVRQLKDYLKMSNVQLVKTAEEAKTILTIERDDTSQTLLSVNSTQQTRQYNLTVTVVFNVSDAKGRVIIPPQTLTESRTTTVQSNQILGSSNEATLFYQQMRRSLAYFIINRIASKEMTEAVNRAFPSTLVKKS